MTKFLFTMALTIFCSCQAFASDVVVSDQLRVEYIRNGHVWSQPTWLSNDFQFDDSLDVLKGPSVEGYDQLLLQKDVHCKMTDDTKDVDGTGMTPKFFCQLMQYDPATKNYVDIPGVKLKKVKVKYSAGEQGGTSNGEIFAEVMGTRLFWALGFNADRMYFVDDVYCYGCTANPFKDNKIDKTTLKNPRLFINTAIERKENGDEIVHLVEVTRPVPTFTKGPPKMVTTVKTPAGWSFDELMNLVSLDPQVAAQQRVERDALRLLSVFIQHVDNLGRNNRIGCTGTVDAMGICHGTIRLTIQDVGATFGKGLSLKEMNIAKANLKAWKKQSVWKDAATCTGGIDYWLFQDMRYPKISEAGRQFLLALLEGFSAGDQGRERVRNIFEAAQVERKDGTVDEWTNAFYDKVEEIRHPLGASNPNFVCPQ